MAAAPGCASKFAEIRAATFVFCGRTREPSGRPPSPARRDVQRRVRRGTGEGVGFPQPARAWATWTGASESPIAVRMPRCCWSMIFQRWRQVVQEAIVKYGVQGVAAPLVARRLARNSQSRAGRATQRRLRASQRHERCDGRPGVVQDQHQRLPKSSAAGLSVRRLAPNRDQGACATVCRVPACQMSAEVFDTPRARRW